ncbi:MAG: DUF5615 family PIN-like protein [Terrimicrobiaceae bacterium]|jgi:glycine cleavage system aminomethyltransferase T|nr:DUF5615 family PIN-like protein [Terrimicrobiaceae bacterium]
MFLLDEHLSPELVRAAKAQAAKFLVQSLHEWRSGLFVGQSDARILREASRDRTVLVTFDVNTIPALLQDMAVAGEDHAGVVFVSSKTFSQNDSAGIAAALIRLWHSNKTGNWTNRGAFLTKGTA